MIKKSKMMGSEFDSRCSCSSDLQLVQFGRLKLPISAHSYSRLDRNLVFHTVILADYGSE